MMGSRGAAARSNPSIELTCPGKPGHAAHVKRYDFFQRTRTAEEIKSMIRAVLNGTPNLPHKHSPKIIHIGERRPGHHRVAQGLKQAVAVVVVQAFFGLDALCPGTGQGAG